ncbi:uncharacterized protein [Branchiostoma lanceolatum]|uniref:uncharacterized protein isoform X1 n=1 Tax=Branchiostoma lanceolatum TaxID=7740 RepID=UPI003454BD7F
MAEATLSDQEVMCTNFSFPSHGNKILQGLNKQRLDSSLCDVTITVQGQQYKAHKSVLAAYSPYFHGMFTVNWLSSEGDLVMELDGVTSQAFNSLLKLIYTSVLTVSPTIISEVVSAATYLDMPDVVAVCNQYMEKNVTGKIVRPEDHGTGPAGLEVGDSDDDDVGTETTIFANAEDDWTVNLQDISTAARSGEASIKHIGEETVIEQPKAAKKKRRWKDEHGSFTCETCGKLFTSRSSYKQHMYGHRSGKRHTCKAAGPKVLKAGIVKLKKKKKKKWETRDPIDGSRIACTCGVGDLQYTGDRCGTARCSCYRQYRMCSPKCYCKHCTNNVPITKPDSIVASCSCGKNDKARGENLSLERCVMSLRCACCKANRPCGRHCRCYNCGNKADVATAQDPPKGDASLVKEVPDLKEHYDRYLAKHRVKVIKGSVADILEKMKTSGTPGPSPSLHIPLPHSQAQTRPKQTVPSKGCSCGKNDKKKGGTSRCVMDVRCACIKASRPCGRNCHCCNCGNKADGPVTTAQAPSKGDASLVKEGPAPGQQSVPQHKVLEGSVGAMLENMRTSGTTKTAEGQTVTGGQDHRNTRNEPSKDAQTTELASAVAWIQSSQVQAEPVRPLPAVQVPNSQAPAVGGVMKWLCVSRVVQPVKVTGSLHVVSGNNVASPSNTGSQPSSVADASSQQTQMTPEANNINREKQIVDQETLDSETRSCTPEAATASSSDGQDNDSMKRCSPDKSKKDSQQASKDQSEGEAVEDEAPTENLQNRAEESVPEDHLQSSSTREKLGQTEKRVRTRNKRPSQSLQPTIVLTRLYLRSNRVNVKELESMDENAPRQASTPSKPSVGETPDTREPRDSERHPSSNIPKGRAPKAKKRQRKKKPVSKQEATKEMETTNTGRESGTNVGMQEAQGDGSWSSRLRRDRKRTWKSTSGEWVSVSDSGDSDEEHSDNSFEKDYASNSDVSSDEDEALEDEEESEDKELQLRKKALLKKQRSGPKKHKPNTIGDLLEKGEDPNKSLQEIVSEQQGKQKRRKRAPAKGPKKAASSVPVRQLLKSRKKEEGPKVIPGWLEEWKKSLSPGTKHTPGSKVAKKSGKEGEGSGVSVEQRDQAPSAGPSTQHQAVPVHHAGTEEEQSTTDQQPAVHTDSATIKDTVIVEEL